VGQFAFTRIGHTAAATLLLAPFLVASSFAQPLVTFSCDQPKGYSMRYGVSLSDRTAAKIDKKPEPKPKFTGPTDDGYDERPTFILNVAQRKLAVTWSYTDAVLEIERKVDGGTPLKSSAPRTYDLEIVTFGPVFISALEVGPLGTTTYSFFPKLGKAFIADQVLDLGGESASQMTTITSCVFPSDFFAAVK
jgi:hypothetical protein